MLCGENRNLKGCCGCGYVVGRRIRQWSCRRISDSGVNSPSSLTGESEGRVYALEKSRARHAKISICVPDFRRAALEQDFRGPSLCKRSSRVNLYKHDRDRGGTRRLSISGTRSTRRIGWSIDRSILSARGSFSVFTRGNTITEI